MILSLASPDGSPDDSATDVGGNIAPALAGVNRLAAGLFVTAGRNC
jgi:hypothetical protein